MLQLQILCGLYSTFVTEDCDRLESFVSISVSKLNHIKNNQ